MVGTTSRAISVAEKIKVEQSMHDYAA
jgi:hypothetical protein